MASSAKFLPEDYSRFLIREFLKKNGFDNTYDQFMKEDTRPKVTMTKNELMKLLGIEGLMKRNTKSKQYETMLDIICDFLVISKNIIGGVNIPNQSETAVSTNDTQKEPSIKQTHQKRTGSVAADQSKQGGAGASKTQANWFNPQPVTHKQNSQPVDDWDIEDDAPGSTKDGYIKGPTQLKQIVQQKPPPQQIQNDPWAVSSSNKEQHQKQIPMRIPPAGNAGQKKKATASIEDDIDDLDNLMGFGGDSNNGKQGDNGGKSKGGKQDMMRDTLGFLKQAEEEKKQRLEQKQQLINDKNSKYKSLSEITQNLSGYSVQTNYDYNTASLSAAVRAQIKSYIKEENITQSESTEIKKLLFKNPSANFHDSWHQGFFFDKKIEYGIYQKEGGPCGILASVQAYFLKHMLFIQKQPINKVPKEKRENYIAAAITDILINASDEQSNKIVLVIPSSNPKSAILPTQCIKLKINTFDSATIYSIVKDNIGYYTSADGHGAILLVYSIILTKGIQNIISDMDMPDNALLTEHGYASQELINIILVGKASSNVFDGDKDMGDNFIIKGIKRQSEIGFLTLFEAYGYFQVGAFLKQPSIPIWVICSESHYSVIFSTDYSIALKKQTIFDLVYYDELARQEDDIILTVKLGQYKGPTNLQTTKEMIPPIDAVIRTKWDGGLVDWNGRQPIL